VVAESVEANWSSCLGTDSLTPCFQSLERLYQQGQVSMLANLDEADLSETQRQILTQFQVQSHLVVPISEDDQLWGLLVAHQCGKPRQWQPAEVNFLLELANQVGLAISQAHLLAQETQQRQQLAQQNLELQQARSAAEQAKQIAIQSCKTAEQAAQVKSAFLATMSHEIRTPLNALLGISELLNYTNLDAQQQEFVDLIQSSGDTLLSLINNVLDFSKLEAKDIELELLEFDLWDCLEEVTGILANTAYMKGLEMAIVVDPNLPVRIRGDLSRIRQVLTNLVGNAIKFTAQGDVIVRVSLTDQAELKFAVQDTGIGIPTLDQAMLFQPFTQVDASTTRKYGGTGLGLAICKQVVECMGGTIGLESQVEQGSTFWFTIPLEPAVSPPVASQRTDRMQMSSRILVIAANTAVRSMIRSQTQDWQVQVDEAANLPAGWHQLQQMAEQESGDYAAVLIDLHSREDWQNWQSLRQTCSAQTRFIGLIAPSDLSKMQSQLDREQIEYLVKPVRRSRLYYQILGCPPPSQLPPFNCPTLAAADLITTVNSTVSDLRILLVEDNEINRMVALKQLCQLGYHADVASNGQAALKQLAKQTYDLVLMDCQMPIMDGFTATEYIRKRQVIDYSPVIIAITANATLQDRQYCLDAGMDDYLSKPIQQEDLRQALAYWSEQIAQQRALPASIANAQPLAISLRRHPSSPINFPTTSQPTVTELNGADAIDSMEPLLDWSYLHRLSNGNLTFERELLQTLVNSLPSHIHNLKTHLATGNLSGLHQEAHYIKGASGSVGIQGIVQSAAAIEQWAQQQHLEPIPRQIQQLEHHFNRIVQFLSHQSYQPVGRPESA
jgi:signal transduction histidine kinase/CheY-like chemotaxis protein/HPt (histidine-containing phosphotransfer) domain-containing protein